MLQKKTFASTTFIIFLFTIYSCSKLDKNDKNELHTENKNVKSKSLYEREDELIEILKVYNIPTNNSTVVLMPPTKCSACKLGALRVLDSMKNVYILAADSAVYTTQHKSQKLILYDPAIINNKGLVKLYSEIISFEKNKVTACKALVN
jgi:hypothetical protein